MPDIIFHIGLHKTATTTLQKQVFPSWQGLNYLSSNQDINNFVKAATTLDPIYFDAEKWRSKIASHVSDDMPALVSKESLSGALLAGVGKGALDHRFSILSNLHATLPDARIIIVLRRQDGLARSLYRQYLKVGGTRSISDFYGLSGNRSAVLSLDRFRFTPYIDALATSFPSGVLVLVFEEFINEQREFFNKLGAFIGIDLPEIELRQSNQTRLGSTGLEISRRLNYLCRSRLNPGGLLGGIPMLEKGSIRQKSLIPLFHDQWPFMGSLSKNSSIYKVGETILEMAKQDNKTLEQRYGLDLDRYGYY